MEAHSALRPTFRLLDDALRDRIVAEAREILATMGMKIHNPEVLALLADHGAPVDLKRQHACFPAELVDRALKSTPSQFFLYDGLGRLTHDFSADRVHFTPASSCLNLLDEESGRVRRPNTADYVRYVKLNEKLPHIASQSTAFVPADVAEDASDSYRLFLSLRYGVKPVVTGTFTPQGFAVMNRLQTAVRGSAAALAEKPLAVFSCCPTSPLQWGDVTSQNLLDCARAGIPVEYISMPLAGFIAPVTLVGSLVEHTAETLSGLVISQLAKPGAPALYGGAPAPFDVRHETTPFGAMETMMIDCAYNEVGKSLGLPTQAYVGLSDAKRLDAQAGLETALGAVLAGLSGINNISGPGMLDFINCFSLEKLVVDNEICAMVFRLLRGVEVRDDFPARPLFEELLRDGHLLIAKHSRRHLKAEHHVPGKVIDRMKADRWREEGEPDLAWRAKSEVARLVASAPPSPLSAEVQRELLEIMQAEVRRAGMGALPELPPLDE